jgi:anti-sigma factor RsiW
MTVCDTTFRHICDNLDEDLDSPRCRQIRQHLEACPDCRAYLDSMKKTVLLFREYPDPLLPTAVRRKLHAALRSTTGESFPWVAASNEREKQKKGTRYGKKHGNS